MELTATETRLAAASMEIDGRADIAATAALQGRAMAAGGWSRELCRLRLQLQDELAAGMIPALA